MEVRAVQGANRDLDRPSRSAVTARNRRVSATRSGFETLCAPNPSLKKATPLRPSLEPRFTKRQPCSAAKAIAASITAYDGDRSSYARDGAAQPVEELETGIQEERGRYVNVISRGDKDERSLARRRGSNGVVGVSSAATSVERRRLGSSATKADRSRRRAEPPPRHVPRPEACGARAREAAGGRPPVRVHASCCSAVGMS